MEHVSSSKEETHLAIAAIPVQCWETPYDSATGLRQGTIFPSLDLPFFVTAGGPKNSALKGGASHG